MYIVEWRNHNGIWCERCFYYMEDAFAEAMKLRKKFGDQVEVIDADTGNPVEV